MLINEEAFLRRYNQLNAEQKQAVDAIYGPVMVIAGPGTGKTEVLSMRIANLLRSEAQVQPQEILCLTYTDEATNSMRRRLVQVIGPSAHKVNICTFHAFCNNVIQNNNEYFSVRTLQPITDLERTELLYEMLEELPKGHALRRFSGNIYFDTRRLNRLFDMMKRENLTSEIISNAIDEYITDLPNRDDYIYKRKGKGYEKGDLKQSKIDEEVARMEDTRAAALLFDVYLKKMEEIGRYDFNDMIIWVLDAFKKHPALLLSYQERNQFILVDEFQDTNGAQSNLLHLLTEFWDDPNVFVVGDDDQSIYEFQGARLRNIVEFYQRYQHNINVVVLPQNYRSSQAILDKATATIKENQQRLIYELEDLKLNKDIVASADRFKEGKDTVPIIIKQYANTLHEEADVVLQIEELQKQGVNLGNIAVLYAQHKQADNIIAHMERKGIPYSVKKTTNILEVPFIQQIIDILRYLQKERDTPFSGESLLFQLMHTPYFEIASTDIARLSLYMLLNKAKDRSLGYWRFIISNGLLVESQQLNSAPAIHRLGKNIDNWLKQQMELPLPLLLEKIIYESGIVQYLLQSKNYTWNIQVLHTFFDYVKELYSRDATVNVPVFLQMIERMELEGISLPIQKVVQQENGVHFYTAHGAKGNEFEHVFLIGCTKNFWEQKKGGSNEFKMPDTITQTDNNPDKTYKIEVARRLFYVALTRAKKYLHLSYAEKDNAGKALEHSGFIDEVSSEEERVVHAVPETGLLDHMLKSMEPVSEVRIALANHQWIERALANFTMSYTTLSKYINCPLAFYYEYVLRVPFQKNDALAFGSAVHNALERMFRVMKEQKGEFPPKEELLRYFDNNMFSERSCFTTVQYERRKDQGHEMLSDYYDQYINEFSKDVEIEMKVPRYTLNGVPVTGKIDKIEIEGDECTVIDYKTGDPDKSATALTSGPNEKEPMGGDYWRQMVFYKLLLEHSTDWHRTVKMGMFDYVEKGRKSGQYKRIKVPMFVQDEEAVLQQLKETYLRIMNQDFNKGCGKEDCYWCNFARKYELVRNDEAVEIDDI